ncbi:type VI secretion system tip protein TssI/VgrG [Massilia sp. CT11-137]|uniref:type VI secretion system Vgr family protein n=1 Tax=Massilia sp. CT11-137 TaxID=3393901 RepID=UPI0039AE97B6
MDLATLSEALRRFGTGLSQHARLITLASAHDAALPQSPLAERVRGREAVNDLYRFDVEALSTSTDLDLAGFIGEELTVGLLQPDGRRRAWHGICTAAEWLGADGGVARYRLRLEPALALLRLRRDNYIFQDKNVRDIVTELFADYPQLRFDFDITQGLPPRPICTQYRESDYDFFVRLMASEGLSWRFEHDQDVTTDDGQARHRVIIFDSAAEFPTTPGNAAIRFHGVRATDTDDAIDGFSARRRVQANAVSISSWDPAQVRAPAAEQQSILDAGELPLLPVYDGAGERIATDAGAAGLHSRLMLHALELDNKLFEGEGAARRLAPGHAFTLTQHDRYPDGDNVFKVLWVEHEARNNVGAQIAAVDRGGVEPGTYRNRFGCVRDAVAIVPHATALPQPHTALGPQTALVVGLPDSVATTTRDHQVRVQFAWQRGAGANRGGLDHDTDDAGCAPGDDRSGTWVRVAEALAGPNWGSQFTPRIGTEVLVDFIDNDIDRPVVVAQLYTGADAPPFAAGVDSGVDHAGTISGIHTQTFDGAGWNQWQLDDTQGQLRMRLATSTAATQLNLGHLVRQAPGSAQRGHYRGSGFELRTDAWAVVRGAEGVLLTTRARSAQGASVSSTQMDAAEAVDGLKAAQSLGTTLLDAATGQHALTSKAAVQAQKDFLAQIDPADQGKFAGPVNNQDAAKPTPGSRDLDTSSPVEKFGAPVVLMDSQAGINWATPASTVLFAGQHLHWTTQSDMHMTAAYTSSSVSAEATSLYAHEGGIQAFAGNGPVSVQAHTDQLEILADKEVTVISVNDGIEVKASKTIVLQAGQASITLEGKDITFACPGTFSVKGGQHVLDGGHDKSAAMNALPDTRLHLFDEAFVLRDQTTSAAMPRQPYRVKRADGSYEEGLTDEDGHTHLISSYSAEPLTIELLDRRDSELEARQNAPLKGNPRYKAAASTTTSPVEVKKRKEVLVDLPNCWIEDHEKEVVAESTRYYGTTRNADGATLLPRTRIRYKLYVPAKSGTPVVVELRIKPQPRLSLSEMFREERLPDEVKKTKRRAWLERVAALKSRAERGIYTQWNGKFQLEIRDPQCGKRTLPITYKLIWVDADEHFTMSVSETQIREGVGLGDIEVWTESDEYVFAHEFGHCVGLPDEYSAQPDQTDTTIRYVTPDGTLSAAIDGPYDGKKESAADASVMSTSHVTKTYPRHAWNIAIEARDLLTEKIGRPITCKII